MEAIPCPKQQRRPLPCLLSLSFFYVCHSLLGWGGCECALVFSCFLTCVIYIYFADFLNVSEKQDIFLVVLWEERYKKMYTSTFIHKSAYNSHPPALYSFSSALFLHTVPVFTISRLYLPFFTFSPSCFSFLPFCFLIIFPTCFNSFSLHVLLFFPPCF